MLFLVQLINAIAYVLILVVIIYSLMSLFASPYHPIREALARIVDPLLNPIRRVVPLMGMLDFSPLILVILIQLLAQILTGLLLRL
jgi:YggT family protein